MADSSEKSRSSENAPSIPSEEELAKMLSVRSKVAHELVATERTYCNALTTIVGDYLIPIRGEGILKKESLEAIFSNIEEIQNLHMPMLHDLDKCIRGWNDQQCIGSVFMKLVPYFKLYKDYCSNYYDAIAHFENKLENSSKFSQFITLRQDQGQNLPSLLIQPIQRIPRYRLLLGELLKHTPQNHNDYKHTAECLMKVEEIADYVNESVRERDNREKLAQIEQSLIGGKIPPIQLPFRKFIKEGVLVKICRKKPARRYFFLFNDILIYASINEKEDKGEPGVKKPATYTFHRSFDMSYVYVTDLMDNDKIENAFQVYSNQKSFTVFSESDEDKRQWMDAIKLAREMCQDLKAGTKVVTLTEKNEKKKEDDDTNETIAPVWVPDKLLKTCMLCDVKFTTITRRHHCRKCGKLVCNACSSKRYKLPNIGKSCRVCDECFSILSGEQTGPKRKASYKPAKESEVMEMDEAKASLAKRATMKFGSSRPTSSILPHVEQLSGPRKKPTSLMYKSGVDFTSVEENETVGDRTSQGSNESSVTTESEASEKSHKKKSKKSKSKSGKEKKLKKSKSKKRRKKEKTRSTPDDKGAPLIVVESVTSTADDDEESFTEEYESDYDNTPKEEEESIGSYAEDTPGYAPPPPPVNEDGFFDYSSSDEDSEEGFEIALPDRAPPPPPVE